MEQCDYTEAYLTKTCPCEQVAILCASAEMMTCIKQAAWSTARPSLCMAQVSELEDYLMEGGWELRPPRR